LHGDDGRTGQQKSTCGKPRYTRHEPDGADKEIEQEGAEEKTGQLAQRWDCEAHGHIYASEVGQEAEGAFVGARLESGGGHVEAQIA
jgi:hypothetical protein